MPVVPSALERLFLRTNKVPSLFVDVAGAGALRTAAVAVRLGVFEALRTRSRSAPEVAAAIHASESGTAALLDALVSLGFLRQTAGRYANTRATSTWLAGPTATNWSDVARWWDELVLPFWGEHLEDAVRLGTPPRTLYEWLDHVPDGWRIAQGAFAAYARTSADAIVAKVPLPSGARRLVDVGGGHGLYSVALCRRHAGLTATILDSSHSLEAAKGILAKEGMAGRIALQPADLARDELGSGYDVALLFSVIHGFSRDQNVDLLRRVAAALNPGGVVAILENSAAMAAGPLTRAFGGILGLTYAMGLGGGIYPFDEIQKWLEAAGFRNVRQIVMRRVLGGLLFGTKPR